LGHVVNFDIPAVPEDYVHRVGRTARAAATGEAFTLVAPEDEADLRRIEGVVGSKLPRVRLEGFEYDGVDQAPLEVPRDERIAAIRARRSADRARAAEKAAAKPSDKPGGRKEPFYGRRRGGRRR